MESETTESPEALAGCCHEESEEGDEKTTILLSGGQGCTIGLALSPVCYYMLSSMTIGYERRLTPQPYVNVERINTRRKLLSRHREPTVEGLL